MQDLYVTSFRISTSDLAAAYSAVAASAARWAWRGAGPPPDVLSQSTGERDAGNGYRVSWSEITVPDRVDRALAVTLRHPDPHVDGREWRSVVDICRRDDSLTITVRVAREAIELRMTPAALTTLRRPGLVRDLLNSQPCSAGGLDLTASPNTIHVSAIGDFVVGVLKNRSRALPVVVLGPAAGKPSAPDPVKLADELAGLAHVACLGGHLAWRRFREAVGEQDFVPSGGARIYWPGFGGEGDHLSHRYWTHRMIEALPIAFHRMLFALLARISVHAVPRDPLPFELRRIAAETRLKELVSEGRSSDELLELYAQENEKLFLRVQELETTNDEQDRELQVHRQNYAAMATVEVGALDEEEGDSEPGPLESEPIFAPQSWSEFVENLDAIEGPAFVITSSARDGCDPCNYPDPARMWAHLESLAEAAEAWAAQDCAIGERLEDWIQENYGLDIALHDASLGDRGSFVFEGKKYSREPHVKVDDAKSPEECGRVYFAYDAGERRFIVDHIGLHL